MVEPFQVMKCQTRLVFLIFFLKRYQELVELMQLADKYNVMALKSLSETEMILK